MKKHNRGSTKKIIQEGVNETQEEKIIRKKNYKNTAGKIIMKMNLQTDQTGHIYFHDVLFSFMKRSYSKIFMKNLSPKG